MSSFNEVSPAEICVALLRDVQKHCSDVLLQYDRTYSLPQGELLFQRLLSLNSQGVRLKIASSLTNSTELKALAAHSECQSHFHFSKSSFLLY